MPRSTTQTVPRSTTQTVPKVQQPQVPAVRQPTMLDSIKSGFGFGVGSAVARSMVDSVFRTGAKETIASPKEAKAEFVTCMESKTYEECTIFLEKI